jgi:ubiquitin carboxyl-terminal hydrolase 10
MCFANAVLQLLVHSPPLWNLFRQLGDLKELRGKGGPVTGGGASPLVDATVRFFEEFMNKEEPPPPRQAADGKPREGGEGKKESNVVDSFQPTYIYDAMKGKRKLKGLLVRSRAT